MQVKLETGGQVCPFPVIEARKAMAGLNSGDELLIDFDCTQATDALPPPGPPTRVTRSPTSIRWETPPGPSPYRSPDLTPAGSSQCAHDPGDVGERLG